MPAQSPVPGIADLRKAARDAIVGGRDPRLSVRTGGGYDLTQGPMAVLFSRQAKRDQGLFRQCYVETSTGADRDRLVEAYYQVERVPAAYGIGEAELLGSAGAGTVYAGTIIEVLVPAQPPAQYFVTEDTPYLDGSAAFPVPVRAARAGSGVAVQADASVLRFGDGSDYLLSEGFSVVSLVCDDGTDAEEDDAYLARARTGRRDKRVGMLKRIIQACKDAGAYHVVALHSGTFGDPFTGADDYGLNYVYVGDSSFTTTEALKTACMVALDAVRVCGCDTQVLGMTAATIDLSVVAAYYDDPGKFDTVETSQAIMAALVDEFSGRTNWWTFSFDELRGAALRSSGDLQAVNVVSATPEPAAAFPVPTLTRYGLGNVTISYSTSL